jgi:glycosyltransferase 2 family protein
MSATPDETTPEPALMSPNQRSRITSVLRWAIGIAVVVALLDAGRKAIAEVEQNVARIDLRFSWIAIAAGFYLVGWLFQSGPWMLALPSFGGGRSSPRSLAAYLVSHLGKYVPFKFMVFVLRKGLLPKTPTFPIIAATFFETFATMAAGSLLAFVTLLTFFQGSPWPIILATGGLAAAFCIAIAPGVYRTAVRVLLVQRTGVEDLDRGEVDPRRFRVPAPSPLVLSGALSLSIISWAFISLSYGCVVRGCGSDVEAEKLMPLALLATPLAAVGGFISMIPGHFGVREWVLTSLAKPILGSALVPLAAAVVFRLVTLLVEAVIGGGLYLALRGSRRA